MRDTMLVWIGRSALNVIEEEDEMEKRAPNQENKKKEAEENMEGDNTDSEDCNKKGSNEDTSDSDETERVKNIKMYPDEIDNMDEEENIKMDKNKDKEGQDCTLSCVSQDRDVSDNSYHIGSFDGDSVEAGLSIEAELDVERDDAGETSAWKKWKASFSWNDFFYSIIFGLGPTAWDVISDLRFGWSLSRSDRQSAGLCYLFITIPGVFFLQEVVLVHILKDCSSKMTTILYALSALVATSAMAYGFCVEPLIFYFPANILGLSLIGVKVGRNQPVSNLT